MELHLALDSRQDLAGQLYRQLRAAILEGRLTAGDRLPPMRALAERLSVSRKTVGEAYDRLGAEGFLQGKVGSGTYVSANLLPSARPPRATAVLQANPGWQAIAANPNWRMPQQVPARYSFAGGTTDKRRFPFDVWRSCLHRALRLQARSPAFYADTLGYPELRMAIARYLGINRALRCDWNDILVSQGAQQAFDLIARVMLAPGDLAVVEEPGYPPVRMAFEAAGARVLGIPVDDEGLRVDCLPDQAKLVYVTPSHQFPLGRPMSLKRRLALLEWARSRQALIIEDDYDGEYRFDGRPLETLQSLDREGRVAYVGTFSKTLFPELRIGYLLMPPALRAELTVAKQLSGQHNESLQQMALAHFIDSGEFAKHTRRMQREYATRRQRLLARFDGDLAPWLEPLPAVVGMHLAARLRHPLDTAQQCAQLAECGVQLLDLASFYAEGPAMQGLLFGFGAIEIQDIDPALDLLRDRLGPAPDLGRT